MGLAFSDAIVSAFLALGLFLLGNFEYRCRWKVACTVFRGDIRSKEPRRRSMGIDLANEASPIRRPMRL
jgi:hypothetical protein